MRTTLLILSASILLSGNIYQPTQPSWPGLENAPIVYDYNMNGMKMSITGEVLVNDTLRVVVSWDHPSDGLGNEDSTTFRIKGTKAIRLSGGGVVAANVFKNRMALVNRLSDTFKVAMPAIGDSVVFQADSIRQCRQSGKCSVPGSAAWGYARTAAPPAMTFIKVQVDSF